MCFNSRKNWVRVTEPLQWLEIWQTCGSESGRPSPGEGFAWLGRWLLPQMGLPRWLRWGSPGGSPVKRLPANRGGARDAASIPESGWSLEREMPARSSILAWETPRTEEPGGLQTTGSRRVRHGGATEHHLRCPRRLGLSTKEMKTGYERGIFTPMETAAGCTMVKAQKQSKDPSRQRNRSRKCSVYTSC